MRSLMPLVPMNIKLAYPFDLELFKYPNKMASNPCAKPPLR